MTAFLRRSGLPAVAHYTVDRLMRDLGMNGVRRGKRHRTTIPAKDGHRAGDLLDRDFTASAPSLFRVADFTYCRTWVGFAYVALIVDVFAQKIVAWHSATSKTTPVVLTPLRMAPWQRDREGRPVIDGQLTHHDDAGSQGGFNWSSQHPRVSEVASDGDGGLVQEDQRCSRGCAPAVACGSGVTAAYALAGAA